MHARMILMRMSAELCWRYTTCMVIITSAFSVACDMWYKSHWLVCQSILLKYVMIVVYRLWGCSYIIFLYTYIMMYHELWTTIIALMCYCGMYMQIARAQNRSYYEFIIRTFDYLVRIISWAWQIRKFKINKLKKANLNLKIVDNDYTIIENLLPYFWHLCHGDTETKPRLGRALLISTRYFQLLPGVFRYAMSPSARRVPVHGLCCDDVAFTERVSDRHPLLMENHQLWTIDDCSP